MCIITYYNTVIILYLRVYACTRMIYIEHVSSEQIPTEPHRLDLRNERMSTQHIERSCACACVAREIVLLLFNTIRKRCCGIRITDTFAYCKRRADAQHAYCKSCHRPIPILCNNNNNNINKSNVFVYNRSRESIDPIQGRRIFIIPTLHTL